MATKKRGIQDPFAAREAEKYEKPIPSREFILAHVGDRAGPASHDELCQELGIAGEEGVEALRRRLNAMCRDGQLVQNRRGAFGKTDRMDLLRGRVQGHKDGYGFFIPDDASGDLFINHRQMNKAFDGDRVIVRRSGFSQRGKEEAVIVEVLERANTQLLGRYFEDSGIGFVVPENTRINQDILISEDSRKLARPGQIVTLEIISYPTGRNSAVGRIIEVLGEHMAPGMEIEVALRSHGIPFVWPQEVTASLAAIKPGLNKAELASRVDLRHLPLVTIDGEDARDFDDAVYCESLKRNGYRLYVAIADVSHYVTVDSPLDREAYQRGTSVYFPEQVVPMLPELLSNDLCSLNPEVDRPVLVCEMEIDKAGQLKAYRFAEAVIRSHARLTYTQVGVMLEESESKGGKKLREQFASLVPHLEDLHRLYGILRKAREQRGAIDFETTELRILFGAERKIERIVPVQRNDAHKVIEECMLCANVAAANFLQQHGLTGLNRIHERPSVEKLVDLRAFLAELGLSLGGGETPTAKDYQQVVQAIAGRPDANMIQMVLLRSMRQAMYSPTNVGHFGLAYEAYAHFTSPIRRYPDLLVHRAIRSVIRSRRESAHVLRVQGTGTLRRQTIYPYSEEQMVLLGEHCSATERRADQAVRDVIDWLKCEFAQDRVGERFVGVVTGVTAFGLFIELKDVFVEGLLHVSALANDYYHFDAAKHRLIGDRTRTSYKLGDSLEVVVVRVNLDERKIDFELPPQPTDKAQGARKAKGAKHKAKREAAPTAAPSKAGQSAGKQAGGKPADKGKKDKKDKKGGAKRGRRK